VYRKRKVVGGNNDSSVSRVKTPDRLAAELRLKFKMIVCGKYSASQYQNSTGASRNMINLGFLEEESSILIRHAHSLVNGVLWFFLPSYMIHAVSSGACFHFGNAWTKRNARCRSSRIYLHEFNIDPTATCH
jgi:hypothetical protein